MIRLRIAEFCESETPVQGIVEVEESYFSAKRIRGNRGRGAAGKTPAFGLLQRQEKVYTEIVPDCAKATLQAIIRGKVSLDRVIHSDVVGVAMMAWSISAIKSITESIMVIMNLPVERNILTALSPSGPLLETG